MKYLDKSFSVGGHSKAYADNFDRIFGKKSGTGDGGSHEEGAREEDDAPSFGHQVEVFLRALTAAVPPKQYCRHALLLRQDGLPGLFLQLSGGWSFNIDPEDFLMDAEALAKVVFELTQQWHAERFVKARLMFGSHSDPFDVKCPTCGAPYGESCTRGDR